MTERTAARERPVIRLKRAYDPPAAADGGRVLVDRLWPRGVSKERLKIDAWLRDLGPSTALRAWFGHDPKRWEEFRRRYRAELAQKGGLLEELLSQARGGKLTLVYGARDPAHNQAVVIKEVVERTGGDEAARGVRARRGVARGGAAKGARTRRRG